MSDVILGARERTVIDTLRETIHGGMGYRMLMLGDGCVATESDDDYARYAKMFVAIRTAKPLGGTLAIIGGGFSILSRGFVGLPYTITTYEIIPELSRYCTVGTFVEGDWHTTLTGTYDIIVLDTGEQGCRSELEAHLNEGGLIVGLSE